MIEQVRRLKSLVLEQNHIVVIFTIMEKITVCYSTHRPETINLTANVMQEHETIILEEPFHKDFQDVLKRKVQIEDHLLELDTEYPEFIKRQYQLLTDLYSDGKNIIQIEPYLEKLIEIQFSFADGKSPKDIIPNSTESRVYLAESRATAKLIAYYSAFQEKNFAKILTTMNSFAQADAARFVLRDEMRSEQIITALQTGKSTYIEAGSIHLFLFRLLSKKLPKAWKLHFYSADQQAAKKLNNKGSLIGPGDILTLHYIWGNSVEKEKWQKYCAQALIYSKILIKEEIADSFTALPHTENELKSIAIVKKLSLKSCEKLFHQIHRLRSTEAATVVQEYVATRGENYE